MQPGPYDWETAYLTTLLQENKVAKTIKGVKHLYQGSRITSLILKATEGQRVYWSQVVPVNNSHWLFKGDPAAVTSVSVPLRIAETAEEGLPPSSESQPMKKRRTTKTKPASGQITIPIPTLQTSHRQFTTLGKTKSQQTSSPSITPFSPIRLTDEPEIPTSEIPQPSQPLQTSEPPSSSRCKRKILSTFSPEEEDDSPTFIAPILISDPPLIIHNILTPEQICQKDTVSWLNAQHQRAIQYLPYHFPGLETSSATILAKSLFSSP